MKRFDSVPVVRYVVLAAVWLLIPAQSPLAQTSPEVVASDLLAPQGIAVDARGWVWVAEQGSGNEDARISVITPDGEVSPFIAGMPSNIVQGFPEGAHHLLFKDGYLWAAQGLGELTPDGNLLIVDTTGFQPGDPPLSLGDVDIIEDVATFVLAHEFEDDTDQSNIYNMAFGPDGDLFMVDASANAVIRRDSAGGALSVFALIPRVANPTPVGPPMSQGVPTGIVYSGEGLFVSSLPGFPMVENEGRVYEIDTEGNLSLYQSGLTTVVDLALDPDGEIWAAQFGAFDPASGFAANAGSIVRLTGNDLVPLVTGLNYPAGIAFAPNGDLYITAMVDGQVLRIEAGAIGTSSESRPHLPESFTLRQNYPNPFNPETTIGYDLSRSTYVVLSIFNVLGKEVRRLVDGRQAAGDHAVTWDGKDLRGRKAPSGVYIYRLRADGSVQSRSMHLIK